MYHGSFVKKEKGFTILELLIVILIIIILMSIVLASFDRSRDQINSDKLISDMRLLRLSLEEYRIECKVYPDELADNADNAFATSGNTQDCGLELGDLVPPQVDLDDFEYIPLTTTTSNVGNCTSYLLAVQLDPQQGILNNDDKDHDKKPNLEWGACGGGSAELPTNDAEGWLNHAQLPDTQLNDV